MGEGYTLTGDTIAMTMLFKSAATRAASGEAGLSLHEFRVLHMVERGAADTAPDLAARLRIAGSKAASASSSLVRRGLLVESGKSSRRMGFAASPEGSRAHAQARAAVGQAFERLLDPCREQTRYVFDVGCMVTSASLSCFSFSGGAPDKVAAYLEANLFALQQFIKTSRECGLSLGEFRLLFALLEGGEARTATELSRELLLSKSSVSDAVSSLEAQGLAVVRGLDRKTKAVSLSQEGVSRARLSARAMDACLERGIRLTERSELLQFAAAAAEIVRGAR